MRAQKKAVKYRPDSAVNSVQCALRFHLFPFLLDLFRQILCPRQLHSTNISGEVTASSICLRRRVNGTNSKPENTNSETQDVSFVSTFVLTRGIFPILARKPGKSGRSSSFLSRRIASRTRPTGSPSPICASAALSAPQPQLAHHGGSEGRSPAGR